MKTKVLFICTHNSARSQMAEGYLRARYGDRYEAFSAGTEVTRVHPCAVLVMEEAGIDISGNRSKSLSEFAGVRMDIVVTVCDRAAKTCPVFPGAEKIMNKKFSRPFHTITERKRADRRFPGGEGRNFPLGRRNLRPHGFRIILSSLGP